MDLGELLQHNVLLIKSRRREWARSETCHLGINVSHTQFRWSGLYGDCSNRMAQYPKLFLSRFPRMKLQCKINSSKKSSTQIRPKLVQRYLRNASISPLCDDEWLLSIVIMEVNCHCSARHYPCRKQMWKCLCLNLCHFSFQISAWWQFALCSLSPNERIFENEIRAIRVQVTIKFNYDSKIEAEVK